MSNINKQSINNLGDRIKLEGYTHYPKALYVKGLGKWKTFYKNLLENLIKEVPDLKEINEENKRLSKKRKSNQNELSES